MLARYDHSTVRAATRSCVSLQCYLLRCDFFMALLSLLSIFLSFSLEPLYPGLAGFNGLHRATTFRCIQARWIHRISSPGLAAPCPAVFFHPRCPPMVTHGEIGRLDLTFIFFERHLTDRRGRALGLGNYTPMKDFVSDGVAFLNIF